MIPFRQFRQIDEELIEENHAIKAHLSHLEDLAIEKGKKGFEEFLIQTEATVKRIQGLKTKQEINFKIDGQMMLLFGLDPRPKYRNRFFISTKSGMSKSNPKILHDFKDIGKSYPDIEMQVKLKTLLIELKRVYDNSGLVYQCDVLYCLPQQKNVAKIQEDNYLVFTPNTITYAIPVDIQSDLYNRILKSKVGIVVHEALFAFPFNEDKAIQLVSKSRSCDKLIENGKSMGVFIESSNYKAVKFKYESSLIADIQEHTQLASDYINKIPDNIDAEYLTNPILEYLKSYLNKQVDLSNGGIFGLSVNRQKFIYSKFEKGFRKHIKDLFGKQILNRKTPRGKDSVKLREHSLLQWLENMTQYIDMYLSATYHMIQVKYILLKILKNVESKLGRTFIQLPDGTFQTTDDEGLVLFNGDSHCKLVDRLNFTRYNRNNSRFQ